MPPRGVRGGRPQALSARRDLIRKLIRRVFGLGDAEPETFPLEAHGIRRENISYGSRKVCEILQSHGFHAYVVGGAVRDLMLGVVPKDFDVATDASPEDVHRLVRRSRLIGRRFKLVHALFGDEIVEVSTFRAAAPGEVDEETGRVLRDNVYGNRQQDAARRDFTVNALYYDPATQTVLDYHRGVRDLKRKVIRIIGDARARFREDPVRMLRAVRLAAKLGFTIDPKTRAPIRELADLMGNVPPARLFDEMLKLLLSGHAKACVQRLRAEGLHHGLLPLLDVILEQPLGEKFVHLALAQTDERVRLDKPVSPAFLFASLLWHEVLAAWKARTDAGEGRIPALYAAMDEVLDKQTDKLAIPKRYTATMKEIWALQPRLENRSGRRPYGVLEHPRFRAGYDFLALRAESGEASGELVEWWRRFQDGTPEERAELLLPAREGGEKRRRRRRRRPGGAPGPQDAGPPPVLAD
ncbi:MAG: polynucleotide adenylyltransferase PcnB [Burkholderiales bacterium]|nr:polynucleotide adenylyltransferase PcnB [Burkholderiales bacterium]